MCHTVYLRAPYLLLAFFTRLSSLGHPVRVATGACLLRTSPAGVSEGAKRCLHPRDSHPQCPAESNSTGRLVRAGNTPAFDALLRP